MQISQGLRLVHSGSVTKVNMKLATVDAGAMIDIGVDWLAYAGNDAGSTPHLLVLYDSAGKRMQGFIGASGGGETYGAELVTNGSMETGDPPTGWLASNATIDGVADERTGGAGSQSLSVISTVDYGNALSNSITDALGKLYIINSWRKKIDGGGNVGLSGVTWGTSCNNTNWEEATDYLTSKVAFTKAVCMSVAATKECRFDDVSVKQVTDISTNGVHLHSTKGGTDRNVASLDSAFSLNHPPGYDFNIYKCP